MSDCQVEILQAPAARRSVLQEFGLRALLLTAVIVALYAGVLRTLAADLWENPDYSYGFLVPLLVACVVWQQFPEYQRVPLTPSRFGIVIILFALVLFFCGSLGADDFSARISLCILLAGILVYLFGWETLRACAFPLGYLSLMIPLPTIIHNQITFPMQLLASRIAETLIRTFGIPVFREGNLLAVPHYAVEVAQACSGIRSLLSLLALGVAYAYFAEERSWMRVLLIILMLPIAILTNAVRIMTACLLGYQVGAEWAEGFVHSFSGWLIFVFATAILYLSHRSVSRMIDRRRLHRA